MSSFFSLETAAALLLFSSTAYAGFNAASQTNIVVYWGQNSYGQSTGEYAQQRLSYYCADSDIDVIPMAFLTQFSGTGGEPVVNFANAGNNCSTFSGTSLLDCPQIAEDIVTCQETYGKTILLSIGGATYTEGGFTSSDAAEAAADQIWATFGPVQSGSSALRPFGDASVDGFDFDFEATVSNMVPFGQRLRTLMDSTAATTGKTYYLTAAPQCPYPDAADEAMLAAGGVSFDAVFVQFYNNYCGTQSYVAGSTTQNNFDFATWDTWASTVSVNPDVKVLLGVPASSTAAGSGYASASLLAEIVDYVKTFESFGGIMMWDASQEVANGDYVAVARSALAGLTRRVRRVFVA